VVVSAMMSRCRDRPLNLDGPTGGHDRRRQQGCEVARTSGERSDRDEGSTRARGAARGHGAATGAAARPTPDSEQVGEHADRPERRCERRELTADSPYFATVLAAAGAVVHVTPREGAWPHAPVVRER
jgi:hypothetical protein